MNENTGNYAKKRNRFDKTLFPDEKPTKGEQASRNGAALLAELEK